MQIPRKMRMICVFLSALAGYVGCILMPLAGRAGASAPQAGTNRVVLTAVWLAGAALGVAGGWGGRDACGGRFWVPALLTAVHVLCLILLWTGLWSV